MIPKRDYEKPLYDRYEVVTVDGVGGYRHYVRDRKTLEEHGPYSSFDKAWAERTAMENRNVNSS